MKLPTEFRRLPLRFDVARLAKEVSQFGEDAWRPHPQGYSGNTALPLISVHGDASDDQTKGPMRPTPYLEACPYIKQVLASLDSPIGRTRLMRIDGNGEASAHVDTNYYWLQRVRVHVPVITDPAVRFICGEKHIHMPAGEAWIFDTWRKHNVINPNPTRRIHLVADTLGSAEFWDLVEHTNDEPRLVPFDPSKNAELQYEAVNHPIVMSPYEQESLAAMVFGDMPDSEGSRELRAETTRFLREWRALWSEHGDAPKGWPAFTALRDRFNGAVKRFDGRTVLPNMIDGAEMVRQALIRPAINSELAAVATAAPRIDRPIFIVSPPRSGSTMLFETLSQSPSVFTIGGESHAVIEGIPTLAPAKRGFDSNRLTEADADDGTSRQIRERFLGRLRDREGRAPSSAVRMLEKTPKNALRIPFLASIFPDATFIYLYRDPRATMSSMLDAWRSGKFVTYPNLPGWYNLPWSLTLTPNWRELIDKPLAEIVARQWESATNTLLDDLESLPPEQWCVAGYREVVDNPQKEIRRLCDFVGIAWDREVTSPLPLSSHTLTPPDPAKITRNAAELDSVVDLTKEAAERARDLFAKPPAQRVRRPRRSQPAPAQPAQQQPSPPQQEPPNFSSVFTASFPDLLDRAGVSIIVSTYQSGRVVMLRAENAATLNTHFRALVSPMGIAVGPSRLAIGTHREVWDYRNQSEISGRLDPPGKHDAVFVPRNVHYTGDIRIHEVGFAANALWAVNTRFSTLCTIDAEHSFIPVWRPKFVSHLAPEDRCHLNGMTIIDDRVRYVTALGATNEPQGWREKKATGGILIDVESGEIVAHGLSMPHSPRWYAGRFWILESGKGTIATLDLATGKAETVAELPGFTRGLAFAGPFAFIGLSQVRESNVFGGIPLVERVKDRQCGVYVIDLRTGQTVAFLQFQGAVQEIFDVQVLHGVRYPELLEPTSELLATSYVLPTAALADVAKV